MLIRTTSISSGWAPTTAWTIPPKLVSDTKELLSRQARNPDRYLVLGPCTVRGSWTSANVTTMEAIDSAMMQAFGSHYVNIRKYLLADGMIDAKFSVTKEDKVVIQQSMVPISFRSNSVTGADLNGSAYRLIGKLVYDPHELPGLFRRGPSGAGSGQDHPGHPEE